MAGTAVTPTKYPGLQQVAVLCFAMTYARAHCNWSLPEPDPSGYPDTEQGQDNLAADYAYFEMEKGLHSCVSWVTECLGDLRSGRLPL